MKLSAMVFILLQTLISWSIAANIEGSDSVASLTEHSWKSAIPITAAPSNIEISNKKSTYTLKTLQARYPSSPAFVHSKGRIRPTEMDRVVADDRFVKSVVLALFGSFLIGMVQIRKKWK